MNIYSKLFKSSPTPTLLFEQKQKDFILKDFSQSYLQITPQGNQHLLGTSLQETMNSLSIGEHFISQLEKKLAISIQTGKTQEVVTSTGRKDFTEINGQTIWRIELTPIKEDELEETRSLMMTFEVDTTERSIFQEQEEKFRSIFENSPDGILFTAPNGRILAANPEACKMFQMTVKELCKAGREGVVDPTDPRLLKALELRESTGKVRSELTYIRKDGSKFPVEVTSSVFTNENGEKRACVIIRDVTAQKEVEKELKKSREKYKMLFDHNPLPSWIYDNETLQTTEVNKAALEQYGYNREEFLKLKVTDFRTKEEVPEFLTFIKNFQKRDATSYHGKSKHINKDGTSRTTDVWAHRFETSKRTLVVSQDLTKWEKVQEDLKEKTTKLLTAQKIGQLGYWELDFINNTHYWTDEVYNIWERNKNDFKLGAKSFYETIHPDDLEDMKKEKDLAFIGKKDLDLEHRILLPNKKIKWVHQKGYVIRDEQGNITGFQGSIQDITEYRMATEKLRISEARQSSLLQSQTSYLIRTDLNGDYSYCNEKFSNDFSWIFPNGEILGNCAYASFMSYHHEKVTAIFEQCIQNPNKVFQIEIDKIQKNDKVKSTLWDFICLTNSKGEPFEVQGVGIDITSRIKAEREIKFQAKLLDTIGQSAIATDAQGIVTYWNQAAEKMYGWTSEEALGANIIDLTPSSQSREQAQDIMDGLLKGFSWSGEFRAQRKDGSKFPVFVNDSPILDEKGYLTGIIGISSDITERKKLEKLLEKATKLSRIGSYEIDIETKEVYWSSMTKEIHGVGEDFIPDFEKALSFYSEENRNKVLDVYNQAITGNVDFDIETQLLTRQGKQYWIRLIGQPEFKNGTCVKISGSFQDIDKVKKTELKVLKAAEEKEKVLESIGDAFFALDHNWVVTYWNSEAEKVLECNREQIMGRKLVDFFNIQNTPFETHFRKAAKENKTQHFEAFFEGTKSWYEVNAYPSTEGLSVFFKDVTGQKETKFKLKHLNKNLETYTEELVTANKGLEQFSYIVSHNLRAPVANILGLGKLLENEEYTKDVQKELFGSLLDNVKRLDKIMYDLNHILQVKNKSSESKEKIVLQELVFSIESSLQNIIEKEQVAIHTNFLECSELTTLPGYIYSIFYNLIFNSIKYRRKGVKPVIKISTQTKDDKVLIHFEDNGVGIDLDRRKDQVFGLYKRFHNHVEGKGMGLFMVKTQVEMLGGKISLTSAVGAGTTFTIELNKPKSLKNHLHETIHSS